MSLLSLRNVSKSYGAVPVLRGIDLAIEAGEIHALMGENGAGKSTLIKILAGVATPDTAEIAVEGQPVTIDNPAAAHRLGLRFIHQEMNVVPALSVAENMFVGRRYPTWGGVLVDWRELQSVARAALARLGINHIDPRVPVGQLSLGDRMLVRIAGAFIGEPDATARLYVMDEPTAALTAEEAARLFSALRELRQAGNSVLYVSHRLDEILMLCDRATVLRDGQAIDAGSLAAIGHDDLVALMIGRRVDGAYPARAAPSGKAVVFAAKGLRARGLQSVDLDVHAGEIFGVAGLAGAGQNELLRAIFGELPVAGGRMALEGRLYRPRSPQDAWRRGIAYVPRERRSEGVVVSRPIFENVTLAHLGAQSLGGTWLRPWRERSFVMQIGTQVRLKAASVDQRALELSGGNQQKVVFAKALSGSPKLLLLDEPTRGVDIGAKFDIYSIIREMTGRGMAAILVSSDLPELIGMCDRIAIMREGAIAEIVEAAGVSEDMLINRCYGRAGAAA